MKRNLPIVVPLLTESVARMLGEAGRYQIPTSPGSSALDLLVSDQRESLHPDNTGRDPVLRRQASEIHRRHNHHPRSNPIPTLSVTGRLASGVG